MEYDSKRYKNILSFYDGLTDTEIKVYGEYIHKRLYDTSAYPQEGEYHKTMHIVEEECFLDFETYKDARQAYLISLAE